MAKTLAPESVELIFKTFTRQFPNRFQKTAEDKMAREVWYRELTAENITDHMVRIGLRGCVKLEWPPSVGEFIKACIPTPENLGLPSEQQVFQEVMTWLRSPDYVDQHQWSHDIAFHVAKSVGSDRSLITNPRARSLVDYHYSVARQQFIAGIELRKPPPALERPADHSTEAERRSAAAIALNQCRKALGMKP